MPTYPLDFPNIPVTTSSFRIISATSSSVSPFTFRQQVYQFPGKRWEGQVKFKPTRGIDAGILKAFLADLQGQFGTFLYGDPDYLAKGPQGALGGTPLVKGASQTGNTLLIDGASNSITNWGRKGDYFQLGTGLSSRLYMLTQDVNSNGSGEVTLVFQPPLRSSPSDNQAVTFAGAKGVMRATNNNGEWQSNMSSVQETSLTFVEAIGE